MNRIWVQLESPTDPASHIEIDVMPVDPPHLPCDDSLCACQGQSLSLSNTEARALVDQLQTFLVQGIQTVQTVRP